MICFKKYFKRLKNSFYLSQYFHLHTSKFYFTERIVKYMTDSKETETNANEITLSLLPSPEI